MKLGKSPPPFPVMHIMDVDADDSPPPSLVDFNIEDVNIFLFITVLSL